MGPALGEAEGLEEGSALGEPVGPVVGAPVGLNVGGDVGDFVGEVVGKAVDAAIITDSENEFSQSAPSSGLPVTWMDASSSTPRHRSTSISSVTYVPCPRERGFEGRLLTHCSSALPVR